MVGRDFLLFKASYLYKLKKDPILLKPYHLLINIWPPHIFKLNFNQYV
jgi:hypothetical protein